MYSAPFPWPKEGSYIRYTIAAAVLAAGRSELASRFGSDAASPIACLLECICQIQRGQAAVGQQVLARDPDIGDVLAACGVDQL